MNDKYALNTIARQIGILGVIFGVQLFSAGRASMAEIIDENTFCEIHHTRMAKAKVPIVYGDIDLDVPYQEAASKHFPHAQLVVYGGCVSDDSFPKEDTVWQCQKCLTAREAWLSKSSTSIDLNVSTGGNRGELSSKIIDPPAVTVGQVKYESHLNYVEAIDISKETVLWHTEVYSDLLSARIDPQIEEDAQWNVITSISVFDDLIEVRNSRGMLYKLDRITGKIINEVASSASLTEAQAVKKAESFLVENGYTSKPGNKDKLILESAERSNDKDKVMASRHNMLERGAFGISKTAESWLVVYRYAKPKNRGKIETGRAVTMSLDGGNIRMAHQDVPLSSAQKILKQ